MKTILILLAILGFINIASGQQSLDGLIKAGKELASATTRPGGTTPVLPPDSRKCLLTAIKCVEGGSTAWLGDNVTEVARILEETAVLAERSGSAEAIEALGAKRTSRKVTEDAKTLRAFATYLRTPTASASSAPAPASAAVPAATTPPPTGRKKIVVTGAAKAP